MDSRTVLDPASLLRSELVLVTCCSNEFEEQVSFTFRSSRGRKHWEVVVKLTSQVALSVRHFFNLPLKDLSVQLVVVSNIHSVKLLNHVEEVLRDFGGYFLDHCFLFIVLLFDCLCFAFVCHSHLSDLLV
ncbi:hypothetical protein [Bacillus phage PK2]|nr:hypothetical protein [Bacillus phage PK2]